MSDKKNPHSLQGRICHWRFCIKCGLVALKNEPTRKALAQECPDKDNRFEAHK